MTGFVYRWRNIANGMLYIGSHGGAPDDGYIGSGVRFREAYDAAPDLFVREVLYNGPDYRAVEDEWLVAYDAGRNPQFYNAGSRVGGVAEHTPETRARVSETLRNSPKAASSNAAKRGIPRSAETREKIAAAKRNSPKTAAAAEARRGVPLPPAHRANLSEAQRNSPRAAVAAQAKRGVPLSAETRAKIAAAKRNSPKTAAATEAKRGVPLSAAHRAKLSAALRGVPLSAEHIAKRAALRGVPKRRVICPHCGKEGGAGTMSRWHFDRCRLMAAEQ